MISTQMHSNPDMLFVAINNSEDASTMTEVTFRHHQSPSLSIENVHIKNFIMKLHT